MAITACLKLKHLKFRTQTPALLFSSEKRYNVLRGSTKMNTNWAYGLLLRTLFVSLLAFSTTVFVEASPQATQSSKQLKKNKNHNLKSIKARENLAEVYYKRKNYKKSLELLRPFSSDLSRKGLDLLARSCMNSKDYKCELRIRKILVDKSPKISREHYMLALAQKRNSLSAKAVASFRKVIELRPQALEAYEQLLLIFKSVKKQLRSTNHCSGYD